MNRSEFIIVTAVILFVVFCLGWLACWFVNYFFRVNRTSSGELHELAQELQQAEHARDEALNELRDREREWKSKLAQANADMAATMDGLHKARTEIEDLRNRVPD